MHGIRPDERNDPPLPENLFEFLFPLHDKALIAGAVRDLAPTACAPEPKKAANARDGIEFARVGDALVKGLVGENIGLFGIEGIRMPFAMIGDLVAAI